MATRRLVDESRATGPVKAIFAEIKATLQIPFVPALFRALARDPARLGATWGQIKAVMADGALDLRTKEAAALAVALAARCPYLVSAHTAALKRLGSTGPELEELGRVVRLAVRLSAYANRTGLTPDLGA